MSLAREAAVAQRAWSKTRRGSQIQAWEGGGLWAEGAEEKEGILRKKKWAVVGGPTLTGSRRSGRIRFKQYLSVGLSCLR